MTPHRINGDIKVAQLLLTALAARIDDTLRTITAHLDTLDGWPAGGNGGPSGTRASSTTEAAALRRIGPTGTDPLDELGDWTATLVRALRGAHEQCDRWAPKLTENELRRLRCVGTGDADGAQCTNWADTVARTDGRCHECGPRVDRRKAEDAKRKRLARRSE